MPLSGSSSLRTLAHLAVLAVLVVLDVRDLWFKWRWLGPDEAYQFTATANEPLITPPLALTSAVNVSIGERFTQPYESGWVSFLSRCEGMDAFKGEYFLHAQLRNCRIGGDDQQINSNFTSDQSGVVIPTILASSGVRADSMAWAACQLLYMHRRPPICHENMVIDFRRRYALAHEPFPAREAMAQPMSDAEAELLGLLHVLSKSSPLSSVVCVEGVEVAPSGVTSTTAQLFGCASPNVYLSAFVGYRATSFAALHRNKAWLTVHDVNILGMHYVVRQNALSSFSIDNTTKALTHVSHINLSSSGVLYHVLIGVDIVLLIAHLLSAIELARLMVCTKDPLAETPRIQCSASFLTASLYRSTPVIVLTVVSQLVSWILVLPTTVIWSWSDSSGSKFHAYLTFLRLWVLVLLSLRVVWHVVVKVAREARAYAMLRHTHVSTLEIMAISACVTFALRGQLRRVRELKYALDRQRLSDATTFVGRRAFSNAYHDEQDAWSDNYAVLVQDQSVVGIVYAPLITIVIVAFVVTSLLVTVRYAYNHHQHRQRALQAMSDNKPHVASTIYARLPAEDLLDTPIRAQQLVRSSLALEQVTSSNLRFLRAEQYLEHGIVLEDGQFLRTRYGFVGVVQPKLHLEDHAIVSQSLHQVDQTDGSDSPTKRRRMSAHVPSLR